MGSLHRKLKRKREKESQKDLKEKIGLFDKIPNKCNMCDASFDKNNKEQVMSWHVAVREREKTVNLYCPTCWAGALNTIKELQEAIKEKGDAEV